jgi:Kef-type K+ transport system membrane component KefB
VPSRSVSSKAGYYEYTFATNHYHHHQQLRTRGIALLANAVPFLAGVAFLRFHDSGRFLGHAHNPTAFLLVFALAMAVTSIPVVSRIMADLGILDTRFARIVLSVAVLEDLLVYVVLNFALALVAPPPPRRSPCRHCCRCGRPASSGAATTWS